MGLPYMPPHCPPKPPLCRHIYMAYMERLGWEVQGCPKTLDRPPGRESVHETPHLAACCFKTTSNLSLGDPKNTPHTRVPWSFFRKSSKNEDKQVVRHWLSIGGCGGLPRGPGGLGGGPRTPSDRRFSLNIGHQPEEARFQAASGSLEA